MKSDIEMVRARVIKSAIIAGILMAIIIGMIISQGNFVRFMRRGEWVQAIALGATVGTVMFAIDVVRLVGAGVKSIVDKK